jgi:hypothetical protein
LDEKHPTAEIIDFTLGSFAKSQVDRSSSGSTGGHCTAYSRDLRFKGGFRGGKEGEMLGVL